MSPGFTVCSHRSKSVVSILQSKKQSKQVRFFVIFELPLNTNSALHNMIGKNLDAITCKEISIRLCVFFYCRTNRKINASWSFSMRAGGHQLENIFNTINWKSFLNLIFLANLETTWQDQTSRCCKIDIFTCK